VVAGASGLGLPLLCLQFSIPTAPVTNTAPRRTATITLENERSEFCILISKHEASANQLSLTVARVIGSKTLSIGELVGLSKEPNFVSWKYSIWIFGDSGTCIELFMHLTIVKMKSNSSPNSLFLNMIKFEVI
jgi:hypothetical protein